ncbi:immunity 22 family protein [Flavobacterium sp.]|uniref:immunity 22 family protein n=1 Tax=Flavobacterium sp. TaxID=239 RepID=UPI002620ED97|nr:immunity 22 family protein [Flavobacterium sp.]
MSTKKIVCVWIGKNASEKEFYQEYLQFDYENDEVSNFGKEAALDYYDEDFIESWWFKKLEVAKLIEYKEELLDSEFFFDDLLRELEHKNLEDKNFITFLFGEISNNSANEFLFNYKVLSSPSNTLEFVFKKEYEL